MFAAQPEGSSGPHFASSPKLDSNHGSGSFGELGARTHSRVCQQRSRIKPIGCAGNTGCGGIGAAAYGGRQTFFESCRVRLAETVPEIQEGTDNGSAHPQAQAERASKRPLPEDQSAAASPRPKAQKDKADRRLTRRRYLAASTSRAAI